MVIYLLVIVLKRKREEEVQRLAIALPTQDQNRRTPRSDENESRPTTPFKVSPNHHSIVVNYWMLDLIPQNSVSYL